MSELATEIDPLTLLHREVERYLRESKAVTKALGPRQNINAFDRIRGNETPDTLSESDATYLRLEQTGGVGNLSFASNAVSWNFAYNVVINTGDQRVTAKLDPLLFALFAALSDGLLNSRITAVKWRGTSFVKSFALTSNRVGLSDPSYNAGIRGWISVCQITFQLVFDRNKLAAYAKGVE